MKNLHTFEEFLNESINEAADLITFSVDDDKLDQILQDFHKRELDYVKIKGDEYYTLPQKEFDRFIDAADSKGFDVDYENSEDSVIEVIEESATDPNVEYSIKDFPIGAEVYMEDEIWKVVKPGNKGGKILMAPFNREAKSKYISIAIEFDLNWLNANILKIETK